MKSLKIKTNKENRESGIIEYYSTGISSKLLENLTGYAENITVQALEELEQNAYQPKPTDSACNFCKYGAICKFSAKEPNRRREYKIDKKFFNGEEE